MSIKEILNYSIIETEEFNITIYEIIAIILILTVTSILIRLIKRLFRKRENKKYFDSSRSHAILQILKYILWITAILISLETIGIKITFLLKKNSYAKSLDYIDVDNIYMLFDAQMISSWLVY